MSLILELPRPVDQRLEVEAAKAGISKNEYAAELLTKNLPDEPDAEDARERPDSDAPTTTFDELLTSARALTTPARTLPDLTAFWQKVENTPSDPPKRPLTAFERGIREKFRKQGFTLSPRENDGATEE